MYAALFYLVAAPLIARRCARARYAGGLSGRVSAGARAVGATIAAGKGTRSLVVDPPANAADLQATIRRMAKSAELKYLVLIGDVPDTPARSPKQRPHDHSHQLRDGKDQYAIGAPSRR